MAGQSLAMGEAFGKGFQYGKRKISSMSNEEFNALNFQQLSESIATDYKTMIPSLRKSIEASDELQRAVFKALGDLLLDIPDSIKGFFQDAQASASQTSLASTTQESTLFNVYGRLRETTSVNEQAIIDAQKIIDQAVLDAKALLTPFGAGSPESNARKEAARQKALRDAASRARTAEEARTKKAQLALEAQVARAGVVTSIRNAGQSQIQERKRLIQLISSRSKAAVAMRLRKQNQPAQAQENAVRALQAKLVILLKRYRF